jgi:hypothetical protein
MEKNIKLLYTDLKGAGVIQYFGKGSQEMYRLENKLVWLASRKLPASVEVKGEIVGSVYFKRPSYGWDYDPSIFV